MRVNHHQLRIITLTADITSDGGGGSARARAHDNVRGDRMRLMGHLAENAVRNIIAAPVGGAFGEGELVHIVTIQLAGQHFGGRIDFAGAVHKVAASAVKFDLFNFTFRRA